MFCKFCGNAVPDCVGYCPRCGSAVSPSAAGTPVQHPVPPNQASAGYDRRISRNITLCADGKYRWVYEYSLFRNPGLFFLIWKIFFFIALGGFVIGLIVISAQGDMNGEEALNMLKIFGIVLLGMTALVGVSYLIYAAIMGGKYIVVFEMDEEGILHRQVDQQARKAAGIADAAFWIGAFAGNRGAMLAGRNMSTDMYTAFRSTGKVKVYPKRNLIKLREMLSHNQVFVHPEDFDFVSSYIIDRVPEKAKPTAKTNH